MTGGMDPNIFGKFKKVFSGHFHQKSKKGNIQYLGNPYQLYWNDYAQKRGFHVFDTDTLKTTFYRNPFDMFYKLYYRDGLDSTHSMEEIKGTYVKLIVEEKGEQMKFDHVLRAIQNAEPADLKIVEDLGVELESGVDIVETEDTLTMLENYIDEIDVMADKNSIKAIMKSLYVEACSY
jgi:DNA repair exonuclease SbcCD nuclease subunit